jgi:hypothetical protein
MMNVSTSRSPPAMRSASTSWLTTPVDAVYDSFTPRKATPGRAPSRLYWYAFPWMSLKGSAMSMSDARANIEITAARRVLPSLAASLAASTRVSAMSIRRRLGVLLGRFTLRTFVSERLVE